MAGRDLYEVLGVARRATQEEIRQAFRRLARESHPDVRRDDPHATERFKEINEAYHVLSDPARRGQYDRFGRVDAGVPADGGSSPFDDIFEMFFGARPGVRTDERQGPERGADLRYDLEIALEDVARGVERTIPLTRLETCPACFGTGAERGSRPEQCAACRGTGEARHVQRTMFGMMTQIGPCPRCGGTGVYIAHPCAKCRGAGRTDVAREVTVAIPAGVDDGAHLRLAGEGEAGVRGGPRGDLYVVVHVAPHPVFTRRGRDLFADVDVSMVVAALGGEVTVKGLEREETAVVPPGTQPGEVITLRGRGLPDARGGRGHLHLTARVAIPKRLTAEQRALLEAFDGKGGDRRPRPEKRQGGRKPILHKVKDLLQ
jgi:molecular chaperone DnaJ